MDLQTAKLHKPPLHEPLWLECVRLHCVGTVTSRQCKAAHNIVSKAKLDSCFKMLQGPNVSLNRPLAREMVCRMDHVPEHAAPCLDYKRKLRANLQSYTKMCFRSLPASLQSCTQHNNNRILIKSCLQGSPKSFHPGLPRMAWVQNRSLLITPVELQDSTGVSADASGNAWPQPS